MTAPPFTSVLEKDPDSNNLLLTIPDQLLKKEDWRIGDRIEFEDVRKGQCTLVNLSKRAREAKLELFIVETVETFRVRYAVKAKSMFDAADEVISDRATEFSRERLNESVFTMSEFTEDAYIELAKRQVDTDAARALIHTVEYGSGRSKTEDAPK